MLTNQHWVWSCGIHMRVILQEMLKISIFDMRLKITNFRLQPPLPGANELISFIMLLFS